jgi:hypothetical protein
MSEAVRIEQDEATQVEVVRTLVASVPYKSLGTLKPGLGSAVPGLSIYTGDKGLVQWVVAATGVTTGATIVIEGCYKDSAVAADWYTLGTLAFTATGSKYLAVLANERHNFMRINCTAWTDGTYTPTVLYEDRFPQ